MIGRKFRLYRSPDEVFEALTEPYVCPSGQSYDRPVGPTILAVDLSTRRVTQVSVDAIYDLVDE